MSIKKQHIKVFLFLFHFIRLSSKLFWLYFLGNYKSNSRNLECVEPSGIARVVCYTSWAHWRISIGDVHLEFKIEDLIHCNQWVHINGVTHWRSYLSLFIKLDNHTVFYSEFHGFRSQVARQLFLSQLWPLLKQTPFFEAAGAVGKIGSSLKLNHHKQI